MVDESEDCLGEFCSHMTEPSSEEMLKGQNIVSMMLLVFSLFSWLYIAWLPLPSNPNLTFMIRLLESGILASGISWNILWAVICIDCIKGKWTPTCGSGSRRGSGVILVCSFLRWIHGGKISWYSWYRFVDLRKNRLKLP